MVPPLTPSLPATRPARQSRSEERRRLIAEAAVRVIAAHGIAGVTHRLVAAEAGVSLAATTYHYATKLDIIADASARLLDGYGEAFRKTLARGPAGRHASLRALVMRVAAAAAGKHRTSSLAWCEIIVDAARRPDMRDIARRWFDRLLAIWSEIATGFGFSDAEETAIAAIDTIIGLIFVVIPLGLDEDAALQMLRATEGVADTQPAPAEIPPPPSNSRKTVETRRRIVEAAADLLVAEGPGAVTYRAVAQRAGITASAPIYHYPTIDTLLDAAQAYLFAASKDRYRAVMSTVDPATLDIARLIDLTATIFLREATEFAGVSVANYPIWLDAARRDALRQTIHAGIVDQNRAWQRLFANLLPATRPEDPLLIQCLFRGKLIRVLATGADTADLAQVRSGFDHALRGLADGRYWARE